MTFNANSNSAFYDLPLIYYKDYQATIKNEENLEELKLEKNENGCIRVITNGLEGEINIKFETPKIQKISFAISTVGLTICLAVSLCYKIKHASKFYKKISIKNKKTTKI